MSSPGGNHFGIRDLAPPKSLQVSVLKRLRPNNQHGGNNNSTYQWDKTHLHPPVGRKVCISLLDKLIHWREIAETRKVTTLQSVGQRPQSQKFRQNETAGEYFPVKGRDKT